MEWIAVIFFMIVIIVSLICGIAIGMWCHKIYHKKQEKLIEKQAKDVMEGKRENNFDLDGKIIKVDRFKLRDDEGNEKVVDITNNPIKEEINKDVIDLPDVPIKKDVPKTIKKNTKKVKKKKDGRRK